MCVCPGLEKVCTQMGQEGECFPADERGLEGEVQGEWEDRDRLAQRWIREGREISFKRILLSLFVLC